MAGGLTWGVSSIWVVFQRVEGSVWTEWGVLDEIWAIDISCLAEEDRVGLTLHGGRRCLPGNKLWELTHRASVSPIIGGFCILELVWGLNKIVVLDMEEALSRWYLRRRHGDH